MATFPPVTPSIAYPTSPPDLALGASIFAEHCTQCHGLSGAGDGVYGKVWVKRVEEGYVVDLP